MTETLGERIRAWRQARHLTQAHVERAAGLTGAGLSRIESGEREPSVSQLRAIAKALHVSPGVLLGEERPAEDTLLAMVAGVRARCTPKMRQELAEILQTIAGELVTH